MISSTGTCARVGNPRRKVVFDVQLWTGSARYIDRPYSEGPALPNVQNDEVIQSVPSSFAGAIQGYRRYSPGVMDTPPLYWAHVLGLVKEIRNRQAGDMR